MDEPMIECPYDKNHYIRQSRFEYHIIKCKKNFSVTLTVCPFNAKHQVKISEARHHIAICPDRSRLGHEHVVQAEITENTNYDTNVYNSYESGLNKDFMSEMLKQKPGQSNESSKIGFHDEKDNWDEEIAYIKPPTVHQSTSVLKNDYRIEDCYALLSKSERKKLHEKMVDEFRIKNPESKK